MLWPLKCSWIHHIKSFAIAERHQATACAYCMYFLLFDLKSSLGEISYQLQNVVAPVNKKQ